MQRQSKKLSKDQKKEEKKVADAIKKGRPEVAKIHAMNAIRAKNQSLDMIRMASRIEAVASRVDQALRMNAITKAMQSVTKGMDTVLTTMDPSSISKTMEKFEEQFDDLDVRSSYMESAMAGSAATSTPEDEVHGLIQQVAAENDLALKDEFAGMAVPGAVGTAAPAAADPAAAMPVAAGGPPKPPSGGGDEGGSSAGGAGGGAGGGAASGGSGGGSVASSLAARLAALRS